MAERGIEPQSNCRGGRAERVSADASRCPTCEYTFTTDPRDPTVVPPHWVVFDSEGMSDREIEELRRQLSEPWIDYDHDVERQGHA